MSAETEDGGKLKETATRKADEIILIQIADKDMVALEVKYNKCCYENTHCSLLDTACSQLERKMKSKSTNMKSHLSACFKGFHNSCSIINQRCDLRVRLFIQSASVQQKWQKVSLTITEKPLRVHKIQIRLLKLLKGYGSKRI